MRKYEKVRENVWALLATIPFFDYENDTIQQIVLIYEMYFW